MQMKKILIVIILASAVFSLTGCLTTMQKSDDKESKENTYEASESIFQTTNITVTDLGDFTMSYPSDWKITKSITNYQALEDDGFMFKLQSLTDHNYITSMNIRYSNKLRSGNARDFTIDYAKTLSASSQIGTLKADQVLYGFIGNAESAVMYFSGNNNGSKIEHIVFFVPLKEGYYIFSFTIFDEIAKNDMLAIVNSVKFK